MTDADLSLTQQRLFTEARSFAHWLPRPVSTELLQSLYELTKFGPTTMNSQPMRLQFVRSAEAKERLVACVNPGNVDKTRAAPVVAIIGMDLDFPSHLIKLFPHKTDASNYYDGKPEVVASTALRNSSLQGAYLMMSARLMGLDCGPMSGFNAPAVDREFWAGTQVRTNFLCNLGYGDASKLLPRQPRLDFEQVCSFV